MTDQKVDVLVIGGGPGGYTAAIRAAQLGFSVAVAEREELGGVCLNWGCIPTKSLLHTADVLREISTADQLGIDVDTPAVDLEKIIDRSRKVAAQLSQGVGHLMRKNGIEVIKGDASFIDHKSVKVGESTVEADKIVIATGARARNLPHIEVDGDRIWDARIAMTPTFMPEKLLVIGAGAIGTEFSSLYNTLGADVTLVEMLDQVLPTEDSEIASLAQKSFANQGISILLETTIDSISTNKKGIEAVIDGETMAFDAVIMSVGVSGNIESLGLDHIGVNCDKGFITVNASNETNIAGVYAIGDVTGPPCLALNASHEAIVAVDALAGLPVHKLDNSRIPGCTYSHPQIASVGMTEIQAAARGEIRVGRFPLIANGKAIAINDSDGLVKTIFDKSSGELLGAHMIGPGVTEMIQGFVIAMGLETTEAELMSTIFPHPTISESMHESVLAAYDRAINF